jgi:hypothetical protein
MGESSHQDDLALLRDTFPTWTITATWTVAGTGPDARFLQARRGDITVTSWSAPDLGAQIVAAEITAALRETDES